MPPTNKPNFLSIAGTVIAILLAVIGYFLNGVYEEIKEVRSMLTTLMVNNGELRKEVEGLKNSHAEVWERVKKHDEQFLKFYQDQYAIKFKK
jgi:regulator of replication initiation timing